MIKDTMVNYMTEDMYSVLCESGKYLKCYFILNFEFFCQTYKKCENSNSLQKQSFVNLSITQEKLQKSLANAWPKVNWI